MKSTPPPHPDIGGTLARAQGRSVTWLAIFAPPTLAYLVGVFYLARCVRGPSTFLGLTANSAEAVLVDLLCAISPLLILIAFYIRHLKHRDVAQRSTFVATYARDRLVKPRRYPGLVYRVQDKQMQIVWNADGAVHNGTAYPLLEDDQLLPFRPDHFIKTGVP